MGVLANVGIGTGGIGSAQLAMSLNYYTATSSQAFVLNIIQNANSPMSQTSYAIQGSWVTVTVPPNAGAAIIVPSATAGIDITLGFTDNDSYALNIGSLPTPVVLSFQVPPTAFFYLNSSNADTPTYVQIYWI